MNKVGFVLDSTAIVAEDLVKDYNIEFVSLNVSLDDETYTNVDIFDEEYHQKFLNSKKIRTSSPSPAGFIDAYTLQFSRGFKDIIVLPLSTKLSGTHQTAEIARTMMSEEEQKHIHIVDTLNASIGIDALFESLRDTLKEDLDVNDLLAVINKHNANPMVIFEVPDLKYLYNGGRLNKVGYVIGDFLKIKPVIEFKKGKMNIAGMYRNREKNVELIVKRILKHLDSYKNIFINYFLFKTQATMNSINRVISLLKDKLNNVKIKESKRIDPVFMSHIGDKGFGFAVCAY